MKRNVRWLMQALSDRSYTLIESPVRNAGAWIFRKSVDVARLFGLLPKPQPGTGILVINLTSHFGDSIMLLPMLEALHDANPGTPIEVACARGGESLFRAVPYLRAVHVAPVSSAPPILLKDVIARRIQVTGWYRDALQSVHPAVCLMPRWGDDLFASLSLGYLIGAPARVAFASTVDPYQRRAPQRDRMATQLVQGGSGTHETERFLRLVSASGLLSPDLSFDTTATSRTLQTIAEDVPWEYLFNRLNLPADRAFAVLAPGASHPRRVWPTAEWAGLARHLLAKHYAVVLLAGKNDAALVATIARDVNSPSVFPVAGGTTIPESIAILRRASLFIGADSGPGHAAGLLGIPSAILYSSHREVYPDHPAAPARVRPLGPRVRTIHPLRKLDRCTVACVADSAHCITTIPVVEVLKVVDELLESCG